MDTHCFGRIEHIPSISLKTHPSEDPLEHDGLEGAPLERIFIDYFRELDFNRIILTVILRPKVHRVGMNGTRVKIVAMEHIVRKLLLNILSSLSSDLMRDLRVCGDLRREAHTVLAH